MCFYDLLNDKNFLLKRGINDTKEMSDTDLKVRMR